jgi:hypothetical protein
MKPLSTSFLPDAGPDGRSETAVRVADSLAEAVSRGPYVAMRTARSLSDEELRLGLEFVSVVLEVASSSARAMSAVLAERLEPDGGQRLH